MYVNEVAVIGVKRLSASWDFIWEVGMRASGRKVRGEGILPFITEEVEGATGLTSYAGAPLIAEVFRASGTA